MRAALYRAPSLASGCASALCVAPPSPLHTPGRCLALSTRPTTLASVRRYIRRDLVAPAGTRAGLLALAHRASSDRAAAGGEDSPPPSFLDLDWEADTAGTATAAAAAGDAARAGDMPRAVSETFTRTHDSSTPKEAAGEVHSSDTGEPRAAGGEHDPHPAPPPPVELIAVRMHNLPRNWLHEEIIRFVHTVGEHAGIAPPVNGAATEGGNKDNHKDNKNDDDDEDDDAGAFPRATSPYVHRLTVPFGRRTGLVYGDPRLVLTSRALAIYLVKDLHLDPDDYRARIRFTLEEGVTDADGVGSGGPVRSRTTFEEIEESVEAEQAEVLQTLELDRFLMAPDLLLDIAKMHQRRLVTLNEKVLLDSFLDNAGDGDEAAGGGEDERGMGGRYAANGTHGGPVRAPSRKSRSPTKRKKLQRRAGSLREPGRGSMHNMPIPKPYVQGRTL